MTIAVPFVKAGPRSRPAAAVDRGALWKVQEDRTADSHPEVPASAMDASRSDYGCRDYRDEMRLLGLRRSLQRSDLTEEERRRLQEAVAELESALGL